MIDLVVPSDYAHRVPDAAAVLREDHHGGADGAHGHDVAPTGSGKQHPLTRGRYTVVRINIAWRHNFHIGIISLHEVVFQFC